MTTPFSLRSFKNVAAPVLALLLILLLGLSPVALLAEAKTEPVTLKQLKVNDIIFLPTITAQRILGFTRPKTWNVKGSSYVHVEFQHSIELIPERSWLQVSINDKPLQKVALGPSNARGTVMKVPVPVALLKDYNTLTFTVEQHYTDKCEDPLDASLWTQILPESKIVFDYDTVLPEMNLANYPYPIIDVLTYSPQGIHFVLPQKPSDKEVQALGYANVHFAQASGEKETRTTIGSSLNDYSGQSHLVLIGTPEDNPAIAQYRDMIAGSGGGDGGKILYFAHPTYKDKAVLIITGNTPAGVLQAAQYLTTRPIDTGLTGNSISIPDSWNPNNGVRSAKVPRYIERDSRTFAQLGFKEESVEKITAPPIVYRIPVLSNFKKNGSKLNFDMVYSYGAEGGELNPRFSALELKLNNYPFAQVPLNKGNDGEDMAHFQVNVPKDLLLPSTNVLVAQFHLMPDKQGFCQDDYIDKAWGKIHDNSKFDIQGSPGSLLPNTGLLNPTGFPYSRDDNFQNTHFVLPAEVTADSLRAFLGMTTRLGRATLADTDLRFGVSLGESGVPSQKDLIIIQDLAHPMKLPGGGGRLNWSDPITKLYKVLFEGSTQPLSVSLYENGAGAYMEQYLNGNQTVTVVSALTSYGFESIAKLLESDDDFATLQLGSFAQLSLSNQELGGGEPQPVRIEESGSSTGGNWFTNFFSGLFGNWFNGWGWMNWIGFGLLIVFLLIFIPFLLGRLFGRR